MKKFLMVFITCLLVGVSAFAQTKTVTGKVIGADDNQGIAGATILVKENNKGTWADENGNYSIEVDKGQTLLFSAIGYADQSIVLTDENVIDVILKINATALDEAIVVAYGTSVKEAITGAVSTVSAGNIETRAITSVTSALDGQVTGVLFHNSGTPGSSPTIRIRGISTVNGADNGEPLYVVDGIVMSGNETDINPQDIENISILKDATSAALYGSRAANGVILITTKKGKSKTMSVRANLFVGAYTRGIPEYDVVNISDFMEIMWKGYRNYLISNPDMKDVSGNRYTVATANPVATADLVPTYLKYNIFDKPSDALFDKNGKFIANVNPKYTDLDWWKPIERTGLRQDYSVSGDAATDKSDFYFSLALLDEKSNIKWADFQRFTGRINVNFTPKKWLKLGVSVNGSYQIYNNISEGNGSYANPIYYARNMSPIYPVYQHDGNGDFALDAKGNKIYDRGSTLGRPQNLNRHVMWELDLDKDETIRSTFGINAYSDIKFLKDFHFIIKGNASIRNSENRSYNNAIIGDGSGNKGRAGRTMYRYLDYTAMQQLTWEKNFEKHHVDAILGHENYSNNTVYTNMLKAGEIFPNVYELINFTEMVQLTGYDSNLRGESYLSRIRYNYDKKYYAEASFRRDGVSRFHPNNRWGSFWSLGASWSIHKEAFMSSVDFVNTLKLRISYGEVGNDASANRYAYMGLYSLTQNANLGAAYKNQNEAANIKWESTNSISVALEGRLANRLNFAFEYYRKLSHDLIFSVYNPLSAGATSSSSAVSVQLKNIGNMLNHGFEMSADIDVINKRNFVWNTSFTGTFQKNKILTLPEQNRKEGIVSGAQKLMEGHSRYSFWLYQFAGVDQMNGNALYVIDDKKYYVGATAEKDKTRIPDARVTTINGKNYVDSYAYAKKDWSGTSLPYFFGSIGNSFSWKNFIFSILCTYSLGGKVLDTPYSSLRSVTNNPNAIHKDVLKAWNGVPAGMTKDSPNRLDPNGIPAVDWYRQSNYISSASSNFLHNASYFDFRNISISYKMPKAWIKNLDISDVTVSLSAENLYTITSLKGLNPQQDLNGITGDIMNYNRTINLGVNIKF
ncbi:MAG: SusC/RagA family TonB-linked outer membrane protein [Prevotellaceae bacterium]|jgi:TonB-linked SusC/RagA family outer membrane protein|nr:SusC/RagA family TonB-linked outer membrane protein [Prevotellaceae bacterium]